MDEQQLIAIGVGDQMIHRTAGAPETKFHGCVGKDGFGIPGAIRSIVDVVEIVGPRAQIALPRAPAGGWVSMNQMCGGAKETLFAKFALIRALGQIAMGLARMVASAAGKGDMVLHGARAPHDESDLLRSIRTGL